MQGTYFMELLTIHTGNQYISNPSVLKFGEFIQSEFVVFIFRHPHAKQFFVTFHIHTERKVDRFVDDSLILADFNHNTIKVNDRLYAIQYSGLPLNDLLNHCIGYS